MTESEESLDCAESAGSQLHKLKDFPSNVAILEREGNEDEVATADSDGAVNARGWGHESECALRKDGIGNP